MWGLNGRGKESERYTVTQRYCILKRNVPAYLRCMYCMGVGVDMVRRLLETMCKRKPWEEEEEVELFRFLTVS